MTNANVFTYKGFIGSIEVSVEDQCLFGQVLGISDLVLYEGNTIKELETDFHHMVDFYIQNLDAQQNAQHKAIAV